MNKILSEAANNAPEIDEDGIHERIAIIQSNGPGAEKAMDELIAANLRLVFHLAGQFAQKNTEQYDDIVSAGSCGLIRGIEKFDRNKGKFSSYLSDWIKSKIRERRNADTPLNITQSTKRRRLAIDEFCESFESKNGRMPNDREIAAKLDLNESQIRFARSGSAKIVYLDSAFSDSREDFHSTIEDEGADTRQKSINKDDMKVVSAAIFALDPKHRQIIRMAYGLKTGKPMSLQDIATAMTMSAERVRQLKTEAEKKIKSMCEEQLNTIGGGPIPPRSQPEYTYMRLKKQNPNYRESFNIKNN